MRRREGKQRSLPVEPSVSALRRGSLLTKACYSGDDLGSADALAALSRLKPILSNMG